MKQSTLIPATKAFSLAPTQHAVFPTLLPTRSGHALKERAATEFQKNTCAAMLTGSAIQYTGALCALERRIYEDNPYSGEFCRSLLAAYVATSAQQIWRFNE